MLRREQSESWAKTPLISREETPQGIVETNEDGQRWLLKRTCSTSAFVVGLLEDENPFVDYE